MSLLFTTALLAAATGLSIQDPASGADAPQDREWIQDFDTAKELASEQGKDLLIDFTGSDWCVWCQRLKSEVFDQDSFDAAENDFVLVELDFPRDDSLISDDIKAQNEKLQTRFNVSGFPTVFLADADGLPYAATGYQEGGAEAYVDHLTELKAAKQERDTHVEQAQAADGIDAAKQWHAALEALPERMGDHLTPYLPWMEKIVALDANDEAGLKSTYQEKIDEIAWERRLSDLQARLGEQLQGAGEEPAVEDFAKAASAVDDFFAENSEDMPGEILGQVCLMQGSLHARAQNYGAAIEAFERFKKALPEDPRLPQIDQAIQQFKAQQKQGDGN